jgi:hypothetical protein
MQKDGDDFHCEMRRQTAVTKQFLVLLIFPMNQYLYIVLHFHSPLPAVTTIFCIVSTTNVAKQIVKTRLDRDRRGIFPSSSPPCIILWKYIGRMGKT